MQGRVQAARLYHMTDDKGVRDLLGFLIARDTMHQNMLNGDGSDGVGSHWWYRLTDADIRGAQLPGQIEHIRRPPHW